MKLPEGNPEWDAEKRELHVTEKAEFIPDVENVTLQSLVGSIRVTSADSPQASLHRSYVVKAETKQEALNRLVEKREQISIRRKLNRITIDTRAEDIEGDPPQEVTLFFPRAMQPFYDVSTETGEIAVEDTNFNGNIYTLSGAVNLSAVEGNMVVETGEGDLTGKGLTGWLRMRSFSGDIAIGESNGEFFLDTEMGDVSLKGTELSGHENKIRAAFGTTDIEVVNESLRVEAYASSGDVEVEDLTLTCFGENPAGKLVRGYLGDTPHDEDALELETGTGRITFSRMNEQES